MSRTLPPPVPSASPSARVPSEGEAERYIERELKRTRSQLKLVELTAALVTLVAGLLAALLAVCVVDHWVFGLNSAARWLIFCGLIAATGYYAVRHLLPLVWHSINPLYAARAIEQETPSLKNSLINYLLFRSDPRGLHGVVFQSLRARAAADLARVSEQTSIDRSRLIGAGYVLAGLVVLGGAYTILSPKDPFQSAARVVVPWADLHRPTRVHILQVEPGDTHVYQGEVVSVAARIRGIGKRDEVRLVYTTLDGTVADRALPMTLDEDGILYRTSLPPDSDGARQSLEYRIEAGDAASRPFRMEVSAEPVITVERVQYDFPAYTGREPQVVENDGNLTALAGTRVTLTARSNHPIQSAWMEFDPGKRTATVRQRKTMQHDGRTATVSFTLDLNEDGRTPRHATYQLNYSTAKGYASRRPMLYRIEVIRDIPPEVEILTPRERRIEVAEDGQQEIEIRALDPDYGLSRVQLRATAGDDAFLDEALFQDQQGRLGQQVQKFPFRPARHGLTAGARVYYWATAADNRHTRSQPEPNTVHSERFQIVITPARNKGTPAAADGATTTDEAKPTEGDTAAADGAAENGEAGASGGQGQSSAEPGAPQEDAAPMGGGGQGESGSPQPGESAAAGQGAGQDQQEQGDPGDGSSNGQAGSGGKGAQDGEATSSGTSPGEPGAAEGSGEAGDSNSGPRGEQGPTGGGSDAGNASGERTEPLHDGEVFEKVLDQLRRQETESGGSGQNVSERPDGQPTGEGPPPGSQGGTPDAESRGQDAATRNDGGEPGDRPGPSETDAEDSAVPAQTGEGPKGTDQNQGAGRTQESAPGDGGVSRGGAETAPENQASPAGSDPRRKEPGSGDTGESGAGENSEDPSGSRAVDAENRDAPKTGSSQSSQPQPKAEPATTNSDRQSNSESDASGDRSGGGQKGPGQGARQPGNDSAGSSSASDDGAGAAPESGAGDAAETPGGKEQADGSTGNPGQQKGDGSTTQKSDGAPGGEPQSRNAPRADPSGDAGSSARSGGGAPTGGGIPTETPPTGEEPPPSQAQDADQANLDYARRATDLVLEHLRDIEPRRRDEFLNELDWTPEDLNRFMERWKELKEAAREDPAARRELDDSLRSLGLRSPASRAKSKRRADSPLQGIQEAGIQSEPPPAYRDKFRAFRKGAARQ